MMVKCDKCGKTATYNVQINSYLEKYKISKKENYKKIYSDFLDSDTNEHYCDKHYKENEDWEEED